MPDPNMIAYLFHTPTVRLTPEPPEPDAGPEPVVTSGGARTEFHP